ncbi:MAG: DUF1365 domain-containing protein [Rhizobiales bacterium]|nr:DUF1365 domain-containing protein [Hyphomicrobiales bacterium]
MTRLRSRLCIGEVVHRRYHPRRHQLRYRVCSLLIDLDELPMIDSSCKLLSINRLNVFSLMESDHGDGSPCDLKKWVTDKVAAAGCQTGISSVLMLTFPKVLGYVFNPLTVYYCLAPTGDIAVMVYEVNNTFGDRHCYVVPVRKQQHGIIFQSADKQFHVSPFNEIAGRYGFRVSPPNETVAVGVSLRVDGKPLMNAYQTAMALPLNDRNLWSAFCRTPLLTAKVIAGIHLEAAVLWLKGLPIVRRSKPALGRTPQQFPGVSLHND